MPFTKMTLEAEDYCVTSPSSRPSIPSWLRSSPAFVTTRYMSSTRLRIATEPSARSLDAELGIDITTGTSASNKPPVVFFQQTNLGLAWLQDTVIALNPY
ncbi:hypothetical protein J3459_012791 [Metarhizium acridum]|nr:hypothetical protein J3459_012791 [Metarhizium acridum]